MIAAFEAGKGFLVLLVGGGLLSLLHHDAQRVGEDVVRHFHLNPASRYPRIFLEMVEGLSSPRLWLLAGTAAAYATLRLLEAYGLWFGRRWAEWLAFASAGIYLPLEILELLGGLTWIKVCTFSLNLVIVAYVGAALWQRDA